MKGVSGGWSRLLQVSQEGPHLRAEDQKEAPPLGTRTVRWGARGPGSVRDRRAEQHGPCKSCKQVAAPLPQVRLKPPWDGDWEGPWGSREGNALPKVIIHSAQGQDPFTTRQSPAVILVVTSLSVLDPRCQRAPSTPSPRICSPAWSEWATARPLVPDLGHLVPVPAGPSSSTSPPICISQAAGVPCASPAGFLRCHPAPGGSSPPAACPPPWPSSSPGCAAQTREGGSRHVPQGQHLRWGQKAQSPREYYLNAIHFKSKFMQKIQDEQISKCFIEDNWCQPGPRQCPAIRDLKAKGVMETIVGPVLPQGRQRAHLSPPDLRPVLTPAGWHSRRGPASFVPAPAGKGRGLSLGEGGKAGLRAGSRVALIY